jgi:hypothetical protein
MKKIVLHGPSTDEAGNFCDAGAELEIVSGPKDEGKVGFISAERARELVERGAALSATASAELQKTAAPPRAARPRRAAKPRSKPAAPARAAAPAPAKAPDGAGSEPGGGSGEAGAEKA